MSLFPSVKNNDWTQNRKNWQKLGTIVLGSIATPAFASLTLTGLTSGRAIYAGAGGLLSDDSTFLFNSSTKILTTTGLTVPGCVVLGLNSAVFQPTTDATTFFQVLDADGGTPILNVDSTNERVGIKTASPAHELDVRGTFAAGLNSELLFTQTAGVSAKIRGNVGIIMTFGSNNINDRMVIDLDGNVGIGEDNPAGMFHVRGTADGGDITGIIHNAEGGGSTDETATLVLNPGPTSSFVSNGVAVQGYRINDGSSTALRDYGLKFRVTNSNVGQIAATITNDGDVGFSEEAPETLSEWTHANPDMTWHGKTHSDDDNATAGKHIWKREDGAGTETAAFQFEVSHDGSGANDQLAKGVWSVNTGSGLIDCLKINSTGVLHTLFGRIINRTSVTSSPYTIVAADEHISVTTASTAITLNLPAIIDGVIYHIKDQDENSAGKNITVSPDGSDTVENAASLTINTNGASITLVGNSTTNNWEIQ